MGVRLGPTWSRVCPEMALSLEQPPGHCRDQPSNASRALQGAQATGVWSRGAGNKWGPHLQMGQLHGPMSPAQGSCTVVMRSRSHPSLVSCSLCKHCTALPQAGSVPAECLLAFAMLHPKSGCISVAAAALWRLGLSLSELWSSACPLGRCADGPEQAGAQPLIPSAAGTQRRALALLRPPELGRGLRTYVVH